MDGGQWNRAPIDLGQLWVIEHPAGLPLSPADRELLRAANVVLYDRLLKALVSEILPIGAYAEPLSRTAADDPMHSSRTLGFARDGWNVLVLVASRDDRPIRLVGFRDDAKARSVTCRSPVPQERIASLLFTANGLAG